MSRRLTMRLLQAVMVILLGLLAHNTPVQADDWPLCPSQQCGPCPATWKGQCWSDGYCELDECTMIGICNSGSSYYRLCDCAPCREQ